MTSERSVSKTTVIGSGWTRLGLGLAMAGALIVAPLSASAQPAKPAGKQPAEKPAAPGKEQPKEINLDEPAEGETPPAEGTEPVEGAEVATPEGEGTQDLDAICKIDPSACPTIDMDKAAKRDMNVQMYAVQQIYALRARRFEINPYFGITMNDQFVSHPGPGLAINWYITNVLAVGINGNLYAGLNSQSDFNFQTSRAARIGEPITEYQWNANLNFSYVPAYGKFAGFSDFIFHYDFYVVGGVGAISTRPIAVIDPDNRTFDFEPKIAFNAGGGLRIFFNRWFAAMLEVRDYIFFDELENPLIRNGDGQELCGKQYAAQCDSTWTSEDSSFTNNVQAQIGFSVFLPFSWEYRLPK
jgi:outer membrane beta-barrel protein